MTTGNVLGELYDDDPEPGDAPASGRLINISARSVIGTDADIIILGFVISGNVPKQLLIRGMGPSLARYQVPGLLADPILELYRGSDLIGFNDNWGGGAEIVRISNQVGAFIPDSTTSADAAMLIRLSPGLYTAQIKGKSRTTGAALAEIYEVYP
jgi:hypothetical protein